MRSLLNRILKTPSITPYRVNITNSRAYEGSLVMLKPDSPLKTLEKNVIYKVWDSHYDTISIRNYKTGKIVYNRSKHNFDVVFNLPCPTSYGKPFKASDFVESLRDWQKETIKDDPILQKQYRALTGKSIKL